MDKVAIVKANLGVIKDIEKAINDYENGKAIPDSLEECYDHGYKRISANGDRIETHNPTTFAYFDAVTNKFEFATHAGYRIADTKEDFSDFAKRYENYARNEIRKGEER